MCNFNFKDPNIPIVVLSTAMPPTAGEVEGVEDWEWLKLYNHVYHVQGILLLPLLSITQDLPSKERT